MNKRWKLTKKRVMMMSPTAPKDRCHNLLTDLPVKERNNSISK